MDAMIEDPRNVVRRNGNRREEERRNLVAGYLATNQRKSDGRRISERREALDRREIHRLQAIA